jgi:hypothetical protein
MGISNFEKGNLVRCCMTDDVGIVERVDKDYYGARQAFKVYGAKRGQAIHGGMENGIGPTEDGIRDRLLIRWTTDYTKRRVLDGEMVHYVESRDVKNL